ncbi:CoA-binding protein [Limtongia smithiae]|uniref:CoA-binding protein n=1 Tax=Limtongia smithiae TaxID=1125753 RepID=UPI0034CD7645
MSVEPIRQFFTAQAYAVVGASPDVTKYGNKILKWYIDHNLTVTGINPKEPTIYGVQSLSSISNLLNSAGPEARFSISIVTPPRVSEATIKEINGLKSQINGVWLQPGSYDAATLAAAAEGLNVIAYGRCVLVEGDEGIAAAAARL